MNQKAHIIGGIILATAAMIAGNSPYTASLAALGGMFNDLDRVDIPISSKGVHRKLFHNVFAVSVFLLLSTWFQPLIFWAAGMFLHDVMDVFSGSPVCLLWPLSHEGEHYEVGGWGVSNKSMLSLPMGVIVAVMFSAGYLLVTGHLEDAILVWEKIRGLFP